MKKNKYNFHIIHREIYELKVRKKYLLFLLICIFPITNCLSYCIPLFIPKLIIELISQSQNWEYSFKFIICLVFLEFLLKMANNGIMKYLNATFVEIRSFEMSKLNAFTQTIPYLLFEDVTYNEKSYSAYESLANPSGFEGVYHSIVELLNVFIICIVFTFLLGQASLLLILSYFLFTGIAIFIDLLGLAFVKNQKVLESKQRRKVFKLSNLGYDYTYGKDIRQYKFNPLILQYFSKAYTSLHQIIQTTEQKELKLNTVQNFIMIARNFLCYVIIFYLVKSDLLGLGDLVLYLGLIAAFGNFLDQAVTKIRELLMNCIVADRYYTFVDEYTQYIIMPRTTKMSIENQTFKELEFKQVSFRYQTSTYNVINCLNLKIKQGEHIGIVGENGVGKTTLFKLLMRYYEPIDGEILLNGKNIQEYDTESYMNSISAVFQDVNIYAASILDNIVCGTHFDKEKLQKVVAIVGLTSFIENLDKGYETELRKEIEDDGIEISIGQRQRVSIARALYKESNILYFDEATSALDIENEIRILENLLLEEKKRTIIFISHNLSNMKLMDSVIFMKNGRIIEQGTHDELMKFKGAYFKLYSLQAKYYEKGGNKNECR